MGRHLGRQLLQYIHGSLKCAVPCFIGNLSLRPTGEVIYAAGSPDAFSLRQRELKVDKNIAGRVPVSLKKKKSSCRNP